MAVDLMHRHGIYHRDLKIDNILILDHAKLEVCVADLGLACKVTDLERLKLRCGTPGYMDPVLFKDGATFTSKSDVFSLGCIMFNMITGRPLFQDVTR